jgi:hypothetical protein
MKILIMSFCLLLAGTSVFSQKKSKVDPKDAEIDSLKQTTKILTLQLDSVSKELVKYLGLYSTIKENIIHYNFDPTRSAYLIDSLKAARDSTSTLLAVPKSNASADSLAVLVIENTALRSTIDSVRKAWGIEKAAITQDDIVKAKAIYNLKQLKELYDNKIITEAEFIALKKKYLDKL